MSMMKRWTCVSCGAVSHKKGVILNKREKEVLSLPSEKRETKMCMSCWSAKKQEIAKAYE